MILTLQEACDILHLNIGDNDALITGLVDSIPFYIDVATGLDESEQLQEPLCKTVAGYLLTQWYYKDHADDLALQRTIDTLLKALALKKARSE